MTDALGVCDYKNHRMTDSGLFERSRSFERLKKSGSHIKLKGNGYLGSHLKD